MRRMMRMRNVAFFLSLFFVFFLVVPLTFVAASAQVLVNELLADPASDWDGDGTVGSKTDEWVEVINAGASSVDMSGYRLGDLSGGYSWRYGFTGTLDPGAVIVVYGTDSQAWQTANGFTVAGLSLNNTGDTVLLYKIEGSDTLVADSYAYVSHEVLDDRSTGRRMGTPAEWRVFDALNPYSGTNPPLGTGCAPTPGSVNECDALVPIEETTWGAIKEMFRD
jgi:hypothetical protein